MTVSTVEIAGGVEWTVEVTEENGDVTVVSMGYAGPQGPQGIQGVPGPSGEAVGVPAGGTTGQALVKVSDDDYDADWADQSGGGGGGALDSIVEGDGITVDATDPANPIVSSPLAASAVQPGDLATVATTGAYADLTGKPTLGTAAAAATGDFATAAQGVKADSAVQPGSLSTVATSGAYADLTGKPTLGTAAPLDVPASGDATSGQVVKGSDTRLSDARTPTTHTHTASQISDSTTVGRAVVTAADAAAGRTAIGAGTSSLVLGTSSSTAKAGDYQPAAANISDATTVGKAVLTGADAAAVRTTLGLGTAATISATAGGDLSGTLPSPTVTKLNGTSLAGLATGLLKNTTGTGVPSIAVAADIPNIAESQVTNLVSDLALKAPLASPTFTGTVTIPTATAADSTTKAASTAYVQGELTAKAPLASPAFTGNPTAPTQTAGNNSTRLATTAYVDGTFAPLASPALTGNPTVPTQTAGNNSTRAASTAYVDSAVAAGPIDATKVTHTVNAQTGTTYTLVLGDAGKFVTMSNASASTLTVPPNSSVAFPVGTMLDGAQLGAGQVTLTAGAGVTINATPGLKIAAQYGTFGLLKTATDTWLAFGRLSA